MPESDAPWGPIPPVADWALSDGAAYLHYCANETIAGIEFPFVPENGAVPIVSDMSSTLLSRPVDIEKFGVIYAGAQKNAPDSQYRKGQKFHGFGVHLCGYDSSHF